MKKYIYIGAAVLLIGLIFTMVTAISQSQKYKELYFKELQNVEAYKLDNSNLNGQVKQYQMTIDELYASKDSIDQKLMATMKELKIEAKKVKELQYQLAHATRTDTITLKDTIFVENTAVDTTFGDEWYNMHLQLEYPSTIVTTPTFNSEQYVYIYTQKEYVGGKSKCFFINWFKKTYTSVEVKVEEKSPYIQNVKQKFIKVEK